MDLKTLEYMEERAKKARKIATEIERLCNNINDLRDLKVVRFVKQDFSTMFDSSTGELTGEIKEAYIKMATNKIGYLEQKLAEL